MALCAFLSTGTLALALAVVGCGDDAPAGTPDAGHDAGPRDAAGDLPDAGTDAGIARPAEPALPVMTPCPPGWRQVPAPNPDDTATCDPWPGTGARTDCPPGQAHFAGEPDCRVVGDPCPTGEFPTGLPAGATVVYVRAGATGGDGTSALPFGTIVEALAAAPAGAIVALAKGTFVETISLTRDVTLWGACAAETMLGDPGTGTLFTSSGVHAALRNLTVRWRVSRIRVIGGSLDAHGVVVDNLGLVAFDFDGATGTLEDIADLHAIGSFVILHRGSDVTVRRLAITGRPDSLFSVGESRLAISDFSVPATNTGPGSVYGVGASLLLERGYFAEQASMLIEANGAVAVTLRDIVMRGPVGGPDRDDGLVVATGAAVTLERVSFDNVKGAALLAGMGTVDATDVIVRNVSANMFGIARGLALHDGTRGTLRRVLVERAAEIGIIVDGRGATVTIEDAWVRDCDSRVSDGTFGRGLQIQAGAQVVGTRIRLDRNREVSALVTSTGSQATLRDVIVTATQLRRCVTTTCIGAGAGIGLASYFGAQVDLERFTISDNTLVGLQVARDGQLDARVGFVVRNPIGANVQVPGYDFGRLSDRVAYRDNDRSLDSTELPLPADVAPL